MERGEVGMPGLSPTRHHVREISRARVIPPSFYAKPSSYLFSPAISSYPRRFVGRTFFPGLTTRR